MLHMEIIYICTYTHTYVHTFIHICLWPINKEHYTLITVTPFIAAIKTNTKLRSRRRGILYHIPPVTMLRSVYLLWRWSGDFHIRMRLAPPWKVKTSSTSKPSATNTTLHCVMFHKNLYRHQHHSNIAYRDLLHKLTETYTDWLCKIFTPDIRVTVSKPQSTRFHHAACGHICDLWICNKKYTIIEAVGNFTYCYFVQVRPDNQATIMGVALCRTSLNANGVDIINNRKWQYDGVVASGGMRVIPKITDISYLVIQLPKIEGLGKINLQ